MSGVPPNMSGIYKNISDRINSGYKVNPLIVLPDMFMLL